MTDSRLVRAADIILIDEDCYLCSAMLAFIASHDHSDQFLFAGQASSPGKVILSNYLPVSEAGSPASVILIRDGKIFSESSAVWRILGSLHGYAWAGWLLRIVPASLRDPAYRWFAANRHRWFRSDRCAYDRSMSKKFLR